MPSPTSDQILAVAAGLLGLIWGILSDRISSRWPAHEDHSVRKVDWRTPVVAVIGAAVLAAVPLRFEDLGERLIFWVFFVACILLLATDLDQRLMPDEITLPLIALGAVTLLWGGDTLTNRSPAVLAVAGAIIVPMFLFGASLPFGAEAFGGGDVKFLITVGLLTGLIRIVLSIFAAALVAGVVIVLLLVARKITLKSYVPFGPFLILGTLWVTLLPAAGS